MNNEDRKVIIRLLNEAAEAAKIRCENCEYYEPYSKLKGTCDNRGNAAHWNDWCPDWAPGKEAGQ